MTASKLTVGILETGRRPDALWESFSDYPTMVADWLSPLNATYRPYAILDGELPDDPLACDLWVITGSKFGVYEAHDWIEPLEIFIRACQQARRKMIGICFGHQLIAQAMGGEVRKSDKGWSLGVQDYAVVDWPKALGTPPAQISLQAYHQDQVERVPAGAHVIARSAFCPVAGLWYPGFAISFQGHPEFRSDYASALLNHRRGPGLDPAMVDAAQTTMGRAINPDELAEKIARHFAVS